MLAGNLIIALSGDILSKVQAVSNGTYIGGCPLYPQNNIWNRDISTLPVHPNSANYLASIGITGRLHADFGAGIYNGGPIGIPYVVVPGSQPAVPVRFTYAGESDPGPYPIPANAPIEGGSQSNGDRHVIVVDSGTCKLYEMFAGYPQSNGSWNAGSGAVWNLNSNALRPASWTSADAAGLPILPGLVRYDEVASGVITHALRFTVSRTQMAYLWPARHYASSSPDPNLPPMGLRLRLKANVDISSFSSMNRVILTALKHYGMFVADNGSSWFISGAPDNRWNNDDLHALGNIPGSDFEVVNESSLEVNPNSAQAGSSPVATPTKSATVTHKPTATATANGVISLVPQPSVAISNATSNEGTTKKSGSTQNGYTLWLFAGGLTILLGFMIVWWRRVKRKNKMKLLR
jgi:hypothetical protein